MPVTLPKRRAFTSLTMTPLIDVVFLLLIFFLVASQFADEERQLQLDLPTASQSLPLMVEPDHIIVNINERGEYFLDGEFRTTEELDQLLEQAAINNPAHQLVLIRTDKVATSQSLLTIIDLCTKAGLDYTAMIDDEEVPIED